MKILIVDDSWDLQQDFPGFIRRTHPNVDFEIVQAFTLEEGKEQFLIHQHNLDVIFMDGCVNHSQELDSLELIGDILMAGFKGRIVALSSMYNTEMLHAGATHTLGKSNCYDKTLLREALGI